MPSEMVQHVQLVADFQQELVFIGAVDIDQQFADPVQDLERHGGIIEEVAAGGCGDDPPHQQGLVFAGGDPGFFQDRQHGGTGMFIELEFAGSEVAAPWAPAAFRRCTRSSDRSSVFTSNGMSAGTTSRTDATMSSSISKR